IEQNLIQLKGRHQIPFHYTTDMIYNFKDLLPAHTNGMRFSVYDAGQNLLSAQIFYSIGGGFIINEAEATHPQPANTHSLPYPFENAKTLLAHCEKNNLTISELMMANESSLRSEKEVRDRLLQISTIMRECIETGCLTPGILPGGLNIQ